MELDVEAPAWLCVEARLVTAEVLPRVAEEVHRVCRVAGLWAARGGAAADLAREVRLLGGDLPGEQEDPWGDPTGRDQWGEEVGRWGRWGTVSDPGVRWGDPEVPEDQGVEVWGLVAGVAGQLVLERTAWGLMVG